MHSTEVEKAINLLDQMIGRHNLVEIKGIKETGLVRSAVALSCAAPVDYRLINRTESWFAKCLNETVLQQIQG